MKSIITCSILALTFVLPMKRAGAQETAQAAKTFSKTVTRTLSAQYLLFLPKGYSDQGEKRWPLMLFLHGAGERGTNLAKVAVHGPPKIVKNRPDFPFILVSPQCPDGETWSNELLLHLLDDVIAAHVVDTNRIYVTGLSMGGYGTWSLATEFPERFAAVAPVCGGGDPIRVMLASSKKARALKSLGVWAFHGAKDPVVPLVESERMIGPLKRAGCADVKLTVYPEAQHDAWTETYDNPQLYEWFLRHSR
jgi:predicted peptidase